MTDDTISRQAAIDALGEEPLVWHEDDAGEVAERNQWRRDVAAIKALPSEQPKYDEWCTDCREYDKERHSCPRWNRVIRQTVDDMEAAQRWIPMSERLPEKDGRYLCSYGKHIHITQMINHHFRHYGEIADHLISAWMPLPEPYRAAGGKTDGEA